MKYFVIIASVIALAIASPANRGLVSPGPAGPAAAPESEPIAVGPAILDFEPIAVGPALVDSYQPIADGPTPVQPVEIPIATEPVSTPIVQIILNINGASQVAAPDFVVPGLPIAEAPIGEPVHIVDSMPVPVEVAVPIVPEIVAAPVAIGTPVLPSPVVPEVNPEPVAIGTPVLPVPVAVLPEQLN